ncbi:toll/interleukin-1 receptor domain-containing protein [Sphingomonas sp. NSE70-1]|uniref:Toll/interleukin-1 receptor domain-containing protein n=1 Tax=Sphingomonas caseinilyticus TaxID=2908205 RepID=A0ABT0RRI8_9SPHN|nr:TIR domain-containing protein [Sphingomonas caseinilyticus]MCL6697629.1 toll/interleukin-1 receptor domain-containing protein [Sphingomonas caseinilyticus]
MATVFLSYDHDDVERAAPIASALEKGGHSVWWDRHIHGGAAFNDEIEAAVEAANAVVVL